MPDKPTHSASFQGSIFRFDIQFSKPQHTRFKIACHGHMYIGQVRHLVASKLLLEPENMRLFSNGGCFLALHITTLGGPLAAVPLSAFHYAPLSLKALH